MGFYQRYLLPHVINLAMRNRDHDRLHERSEADVVHV
jgi:hypothetical protein